MSELSKWRVQKNIIDSLFAIYKESNKNDIFEPFSQYLLNFMVEGCHQVRLIACETLAKSFVLLPDFEKRKNLMKFINEDFYANGNYQKKETFVHFANYCLDVFSRPAFKFFLLNKLLALSNTEI